MMAKLTPIPVYPFNVESYSCAKVSNKTTCVNTIDVNAFAKFVIFIPFIIVRFNVYYNVQLPTNVCILFVIPSYVDIT